MPIMQVEPQYTVEQVKEHIRNLSSMKALRPEDYCEEGGLAHSLVQAKGFGKDDLKITQLRKVFGELQRINRQVEREKDKNAEFNRSQILPLLPVLAYAKGRKLIPEDFYELMRMSLDAQRLKTNEDFLRFYDFFRAVIAFHKFYNAS